MQLAHPAVAAYRLFRWQCLSGWLASRAASGNSNCAKEIAAYRSRQHNEDRSLNGPYPALEDLPPSPAGISRTLRACPRMDVNPAHLYHYCCLLSQREKGLIAAHPFLQASIRAVWPYELDRFRKAEKLCFSLLAASGLGFATSTSACRTPK